MNKIKIVTFTLIFLISFFPKVFSEDRCGNFFAELKDKYEIYEPNNTPRWIAENFGFEIKVFWNDKSREWDFETSKNGYFLVGKINDPDLIGTLETGDEIISIKYSDKDIDLRDLGLDNNNNFFEDAYEVGDVLKFVFKRDKKFNLELKKKEFDVQEPFMDIYILSMDIDDKSNKFYVRLKVDSQHSYTEEDKIYELAMKNLYVGKKNEVDDEDFTYGCTFDVENWTDENFALPIDGQFIDVHSINFNTFEDYVFVKPYSTLVKEHEDLGWSNELIVNYSYTGNYEFNNKYDLRNFPFDKQNIKIHYVAGENLDEKLLSLSDYSQNMLLDFKNKQSITGWNIKDVSLKYSPNQDPIDLSYSDGVSINIEIERKYGYYLYKVILPIILILMICWSSLWIPYNELESKLTITIVCLLSLIAYNFVIDKDLPKLEYLTILDWIILVSYFYATIPNFLSVYFFRLSKQRNKTKLRVYETFFRKYGALSYLTIIFIIILFNVQINPISAASIISWMKI